MRVVWVAIGVALVAAGPLRAATCGNGAIEPPELCDDGNLVDGDGCDSNCTPTACGNGIVTAGEDCDDGNTISGDCCSATCRAENHPPVCAGAYPSPSQLWPPNHKRASVAILGVTDPDGDPLTIQATAIAQDEPIDASGSGATCPDATGIGLDTVDLRSERSGQGDGRVYHVAFQATDRCNAACTGEVTVAVPHDRSPKKSVGDGGPLYDSTLGEPPCHGDGCDPTDCVPDPGDVDACREADVPASVSVRLAHAKALLRRRSRKSRRVAAILLVRAKGRVLRAGKRGTLPGPCATALARSLDGGTTCAACSGD